MPCLYPSYTPYFDGKTTSLDTVLPGDIFSSHMLSLAPQVLPKAVIISFQIPSGHMILAAISGLWLL